MVLAALLPALLLAAAPVAAAPVAPEAAAPPAQKRAKVVVGDFVLAGAAHPDLARVLSDAAAKGVQGSPGLMVMGQGEISAILGLEKTRQMMGCSEEQGCVSELGKALDADFLVSGSLTLLERTALLTVRFIDVRKNQTQGRSTAMLLDATEGELVDGATRLAHEAVTGKKLDTSGTIRVSVSRTGADVTLDGKSLGSSPVSGTQRVLEGPHTVTVQKQGYIRWSSTVSVAAGQALAVDADLVPLVLQGEAARSRLWTWGWVSAGVAVAAGSAGVLFGKMSDDSYAKYKVATERSTAVQLHDQTAQRTTLANASWAVAGTAALASVGLLVTAIVQDARAANDLAPAPAPDPGLSTTKKVKTASAEVYPLPGGAAMALTLNF
jgi:hypothetical protein